MKFLIVAALLVATVSAKSVKITSLNNCGESISQFYRHGFTIATQLRVILPKLNITQEALVHQLTSQEQSLPIPFQFQVL